MRSSRILALWQRLLLNRPPCLDGPSGRVDSSLGVDVRRAQHFTQVTDSSTNTLYSKSQTAANATIANHLSGNFPHPRVLPELLYRTIQHITYQ